jgi:ABC-2 type transport system ATP-binding protein
VSDTTAIEISGLTKRYGDVEAVRGIDLAIREGEVFGFVGPNGAGKSTTIRCVLDLIRPTDGRISVFGLDPRADGVSVRGRVGYVPGELRLPERLSAHQLLDSIARLRGGLDERRRDAIVERLRIPFDRRMRDLSTGNRRKVALLLAFSVRPELLILDEPTSGLDPLIQHEFLGMVREAREDGATVFLSSHVLSEVQRSADRVAVLRAGRIVAEGTVDELRGRARQRVEVWFTDDAPIDDLRRVEGLVDPLFEGRRLSATLSGSVESLLAVLARHPVVSVVLEEPDLEDAFLDLYAESA